MSGSNMQKMEIESTNKKGKLPIYVAQSSKQSGKKAGIVMIQEWWGINEQIKRQAVKWYADSGFDVVVPDLYRGKVTDDQEEAGHMMNDLDFPGAVEDVQAAVKHLKSQGYERIGVTGVCMAEHWNTIASAVKVSNVDAAVCFYGIPDGKYFPPEEIKTPIQLHFGTADEMKGFSDPESADALEKKLKQGNINYEFYRYEGAGHAFTNDTHDKDVEKRAAEVAHKRAIDFFNKHLKQ